MAKKNAKPTESKQAPEAEVTGNVTDQVQPATAPEVVEQPTPEKTPDTKPQMSCEALASKLKASGTGEKYLEVVRTSKNVTAAVARLKACGFQVTAKKAENLLSSP